MAINASLQSLWSGTGRTLARLATATNSLINSDGGELVVAQGLPPEAELARKGLLLGTVCATGAVGCVALPTTAAALSLYNANTGTRCLVISAVGVTAYTGSVSASNFTTICRNDVPGQNTAIAATNIIFGCDGRNYSGGATAKDSVTLAAISASNNVGWIPVGQSVLAGSPSLYGTATYADVYGKFIVRPGGVFSVNTLYYTATSGFKPFIFFYEIDLQTP